MYVAMMVFLISSGGLVTSGGIVWAVADLSVFIVPPPKLLRAMLATLT